jgi:hypothetical protein
MATIKETPIAKNLDLFKSDLGKDKQVTERFNALYTEKQGDWQAIGAALTAENGFTPEVAQKLHFTQNLSVWSGANKGVVGLFQKDGKTNSMRDIALLYSQADFIQKTACANMPVTDEVAEVDTEALYRALFQQEPTAMLLRMVGNDLESPISDAILRVGVEAFLKNQPASFDIKRVSIYEAFKHPEAFKGIKDEQQENVKASMKALQLVTTISPTDTVVRVLMQSNIKSSMQVSDMPEAQFVRTYAPHFGANGVLLAQQTHYNAMNAKIRNEHALMALREAGRGTGIAFIDKSLNLINTSPAPVISTRMAIVDNPDKPTNNTVLPNQVDNTQWQTVTDKTVLTANVLNKHNLSWDTLFGDADICECGECTSVYSAAAYFVELLQYLRNNNLEREATGPVKINPDAKSIADTPLEKLFNRRPDLGCLQLTCKNTNTILPYVDLVNEVMESYVVHQSEVANKRIVPYNVIDETSGELLSEPQHTDYKAYCILKNAVYPFTLPYHQPIDAARVYLNHLGTSRYELIDTFRSARTENILPDGVDDCTTNNVVTGTDEPIPPFNEKVTPITDHDAYINRAADAEYLGLSQEEYVILTTEAFVSNKYWNDQTTAHTLDEYATKIGIRKVHEYYGYTTEAEMRDETLEKGLTYVKKQFLPRTGVLYTDLVDLLKTQYLNPNMPKGKDLSILENIRFSYQYLMDFVDKGPKITDPNQKYAKLIDVLVKAAEENKPSDDPCPPATNKTSFTTDRNEITNWVINHFEKIGKLIVLDTAVSFDGATITPAPKTTQGLNIVTSLDTKKQQIALLSNNILSIDTGFGKQDIATFNYRSGELKGKDEAVSRILKDATYLGDKGQQAKVVGQLGKTFLVDPNTGKPFSANHPDSCNINTVRLVHLDGSPVEVEEYDHIHRFIRLWRKLGWTIDETDKALIGLIKPEGNREINPDLLHQFVAVKKLSDLTGLELIKLLSFWTDISTVGEKSLYKRLFLTHNVQGIDTVFKANDQGEYLGGTETISNYLPVIMAALNLNADDIAALKDVLPVEQNDRLSINNLSIFYRYRLLSKVLGLRVPAFIQVTKLLGSPFKNTDAQSDAHATLTFLERWQRMEDAGFDYKQLNYIIKDIDEEKKPFAPSEKAILVLAKTLYDGLNAIDEAYKDISEEDEITIESLHNKLTLIYEQSTVESITSFVEGSTLYKVFMPANLKIKINLDENLTKKLTYNKSNGGIAIKGILEEEEKNAIKLLGKDLIEDEKKQWENGIDTAVLKVERLFTEILNDFVNEATKINLLQPDTNDTTTVKTKKIFESFLPYLRKKLTARFIIATLSTQSDLDRASTELLISTVLKNKTDPTKSLFTVFEALKKHQASLDWSGYLIPTIDGYYTFVVENAVIGFDANSFTIQIDDDKTLIFEARTDIVKEFWAKEPQKLQAGKVYKFTVKGLSEKLEGLKWKTPTTTLSVIPSGTLLPNYANDSIKSALTVLQKAAMLINGFTLGADEIAWLDSHKEGFDNINFGQLEWKHFLRLEAYTRLRNSLPQPKTNILDFWKWTFEPQEDPSVLSQKIADLTLWNVEKVKKLIAAEHFNLEDKTKFHNEESLLKLQKAVAVADKVGIDTDLLFEWAKPTSNFKICRKHADSIRNTLRAQYKQTDWEEVVKPLSDQLRENQKNALIGYLLQQKPLIDWGVTDADGLFEYFLIDVQMDACMETSRIKQGLSSIQLFVQRCFLGLEEQHSGIRPNVLDRARWDWMQRYRVWEANRKVFLYPENWIESNLRDDKSPFFKELESELLQKDINKQNVEDALKAYLYKVDEVANMEVIGLYIEGEMNSEGGWSKKAKLHVFSRTRNAPYFFYYRYLALDEMNWYAWEKMQVDIPSYDVDDAVTHQTDGNGCYLTPVVWNGRLLIFFPQFMKKTRPNPNNASSSIVRMANNSPEANKPIEFWGIKMAWSEYRNGKWTQKQLSKEAVYDETLMTETIAEYHGIVQILKNIIDLLIEAEKFALKIYNEWGLAFDTNLKLLLKKDIDNCKTKIEDVKGKIYYIENVLNIKSLLKLDECVESLNSALKIINEYLSNFPNYFFLPQQATEYKDNEIFKAKMKVVDIMNFYLYSPMSASAPDISKYEFVPVLSKQLGIRVFWSGNTKDGFEFDGSQINKIKLSNYSHELPSIDMPQFFNKNNSAQLILAPLKIKDNRWVKPLNRHYDNVTYSEIELLQRVYVPIIKDYILFPESFDFYHPHTRTLLGTINTGQLKEFFNFNLHIKPSQKADAFGSYDPDNNVATVNNPYNELKRPYSLYNWELFFHTPMMLADALSKSQHFEEAMKWYHFVFNPMAQGTDDKRFWQFTPFKEVDAQNILDAIFNNLKPNTADTAINEWRNKPFMPHLVARSRPVAYMKWVVMKYLDNLMAWGDYLFRQDTIESINQATQLYVLAGHILGSRPQTIPKRGKTRPQTYLSLLDKWDAFGNAIDEFILIAPNSSQSTVPIGENGESGTANIYGSASALYFCIPSNPKLLGYWDTISDRLFKIRHCENIEGIFRKLPLFEPPIDPALLVNAAAQGLSIASVLNDLNTPMPNYRFYYLLQKALELCNELKSLGGAMLSAIEKKDNETIALIRAKHESTMHNLVMEIKKHQLEEAQKSLESLQQNRKAPEHRMKYYLQLIGEDTGKVPNADGDFSELANAIEKPLDESELKLSKYEHEEMDKLNQANNVNIAVGILETMASGLLVAPTFGLYTAPMGTGSTLIWGSPNIGNGIQAIARMLQTISNHLAFDASMSSKKGGFQRALQDRIFQANSAGYEIKQIDKQIVAQQIRIAMANQEITNQQKMIDNAQEIEEFLKNKYTNEELYTWMRGSLKTLYHQVYSLAFDLAKKAEKTFRFERGLTSSNFIQAGYWNEGYDGLLSGEQLYVGLKQLEAAYQENRGYDYEITKHISLRQINPMAVLQLKETGTCEFELPEVLFDMDYPGHFKRRIKSVSLSIPCVAGPYTNINATLRLLGNKFRNTAITKNAADYLEKTEETDERFNSFIIPISAIAASSAQNDGGMFELNFKDERYLPFEGAGVVSKWRLELPNFRQFDYDTISDAVVHLRYISTEGGDRLKKAALDTTTNFMKSVEELGQQEGLFAIIDLQHDLPTEWHKAMQGKTIVNGKDSYTLSIPDTKRFLPLYATMNGKTPKVENIKIAITTNKTPKGTDLTPILQFEQQDFKFEIGTGEKIEKSWMVIRFTLG